MLSRARNDWLRAEKAKAAALERYTAAQLGDFLDAAAPAEPLPPNSKVVKPIFGQARSGRPPVLPPSAEVSQAVAAAQAAIVVDLAARQAPPSEETARDRFRRARELEVALQAGSAVTRDQERWLSQYQTTPEYRSERLVWEDFGEAYLG